MNIGGFLIAAQLSQPDSFRPATSQKGEVHTPQTKVQQIQSDSLTLIVGGSTMRPPAYRPGPAFCLAPPGIQPSSIETKPCGQMIPNLFGNCRLSGTRWPVEDNRD